MTSRSTAAVLFVAASLAVPSAAKDLASSLKGEWNVDKAAAFEAAAPPAYKAATPEKQKEMREEMLKSMPDMVIEFTADTVSMKAGAETKTATYKVTKSEKSTVWFDAVDKKKDGTETVDKLFAEFLDADTITLAKEGDPLVLKLTRQK
jgi:hypothetical protein